MVSFRRKLRSRPTSVCWPEPNGKNRPRLWKNAEPRKFRAISYLRQPHAGGATPGLTENERLGGKELRAILTAASFYTAWTHGRPSERPRRGRAVGAKVQSPTTRMTQVGRSGLWVEGWLPPLDACPRQRLGRPCSLSTPAWWYAASLYIGPVKGAAF